MLVGIQVFADLSQYTFQMRSQLNLITKALCKQKISYDWQYLATLLITCNSTMLSVTTLDGGIELLPIRLYIYY